MSEITAAPATTGPAAPPFRLDPMTAAILSWEFGGGRMPAPSFPASSTTFVPQDVVVAEDDGPSTTTIVVAGVAILAAAAAFYYATR